MLHQLPQYYLFSLIICSHGRQINHNLLILGLLRQFPGDEADVDRDGEVDDEGAEGGDGVDVEVLRLHVLTQHVRLSVTPHVQWIEESVESSNRVHDHLEY